MKLNSQNRKMKGCRSFVLWSRSREEEKEAGVWCTGPGKKEEERKGKPWFLEIWPCREIYRRDWGQRMSRYTCIHTFCCCHVRFNLNELIYFECNSWSFPRVFYTLCLSVNLKNVLNCICNVFDIHRASNYNKWFKNGCITNPHREG